MLLVIVAGNWGTKARWKAHCGEEKEYFRVKSEFRRIFLRSIFGSLLYVKYFSDLLDVVRRVCCVLLLL